MAAGERRRRTSAASPSPHTPLPPCPRHHTQVTVWYGAVLRGDLNSIKVGAFSSIGDRTVVHAAR